MCTALQLIETVVIGKRGGRAHLAKGFLLLAALMEKVVWLGSLRAIENLQP